MEMTAQQHEVKKKPTKKEAINKIPIVTITEIHCKKQEGTQKLETPLCTVCQDNVNMGSKAMVMPCGHIFHPDCVLPWLKDNNTCPVCRYELPTDAK